MKEKKKKYVGNICNHTPSYLDVEVFRLAEHSLPNSHLPYPLSEHNEHIRLKE